jgi:hypothetical protein
MAEPVYGFKKDDAYALKDLLQGQRQTAGVSNLEQMDGTAICVATTGIPARSGTTLGRATVEKKKLVSSGAFPTQRSIASIAANNTITAYNLASSPVASGAYIIVQRIAGAWIVIWEQC